MHVLLATDYYPPFIGGGQRWAQLLARGLHEAGHKVTVITAWSGGQERVESGEGWPVHRLRQVRTWPTTRVTDRAQRQLPPFPDPVAVRDARAVIASGRPDVCIAYGWIAMNVLGPCSEHDIPVMLSNHDYGSFCATRTLLERGAPCDGPGPIKCVRCAADFYGPAIGGTAAASLMLSQPRFRRHVAAMHSVSTFVDAECHRSVGGSKGLPDSVPRYIIPAFLLPPEEPDAEALASLAPYVDRLPSEPFIFFAGALRRLKGVDLLIEAHQLLIGPRPPLVLMGAPYPDTPSDLPSGVSIIESAPHGAVMIAMQRALMSVFPSVWPEPLGTVTMESISQGCPTIATRPGGMEDILRDGAGVLVQRGSVEELRAAMQRLVDDPLERERLGTTGLAAAAKLNYAATMGQYLDAFTDLVERWRQRR